MIYNLLRNALLAWLMHAAVSAVLDGHGEATAETPAVVAAVPATSCAMPAVLGDSLVPLAAHDAFDLRILPNEERNLRGARPTLAGAHS